MKTCTELRRSKCNIPIVVLILVAFIAILVACGRSQVQKPAAERSQAQVEQPKESVSDAGAKQGETEHHEGDEHSEAEHEETEHHEGDGHLEARHEEAGHLHSPEEHMAGHHDVPEEAAAVENPIPATEESVVAGATIFAQNCAVCHGETGEGNGPAATALEEKPANLHEDHVQGLSDGALFWIISHGVAKSPMPPWDKVLTEEERWHVVNFLRTFNENQ